ncbi:hypothetical protein E1293_07260 [Actinomadura darangshiensis]|uniref:Uncharacterized protein n=1 Tax=Actinomadura darangshiensis TaxID=705336 RepID=A0A4R5BUA7_9ACTN|nr:hypothetical protein [Actinomadura darangshiensis]TDD87802.1 hypothetical protein E1293_07260 [Actinomadura darangshiensis]
MGESWTGPGGLRVTAVRLTGTHRVWAGLAGVRGPSAFLVTRKGRLVGRGYFPSVEDLAEVVDLAELRAE